MPLALDEDDTMTPTERALMAEVGDEGESEWAGGSFNKKIKKNQKRVQDSNFVFIWLWIPDLQIYLLARHVQRTFDEDKHENQMFSLSVVYCFFLTIFVPIRSKQQAKPVMTLSVCKNVQILIFGATGSTGNVLRASCSTVK